MELRRWFVLAVAVVLVGALVQGCTIAVVGAAGAGTVAYVRGDLEVVESARLDAVYKAAEKAVGQLELNVVSKTKDALSAAIVARDAHDKKIRIKLKATAEGSTKLSIRIGIFGDETKSRLIYNKIKENL